MQADDHADAGSEQVHAMKIRGQKNHNTDSRDFENRDHPELFPKVVAEISRVRLASLHAPARTAQVNQCET
jgi:hypothetical protein